MARQRDYRAEYLRRRALQAQREQEALARPRRVRDYRAEYLRRKARKLAAQAPPVVQSAPEPVERDPVEQLIGRLNRGDRFPKGRAGRIASELLARGENPREFFNAWYA